MVYGVAAQSFRRDTRSHKLKRFPIFSSIEKYNIRNPIFYARPSIQSGDIEK